MRLRTWNNDSAPCMIPTFKVSGICEKLRPTFRYYRNTFYHATLLDQSWTRFPGIVSTSSNHFQNFVELFKHWDMPKTEEEELEFRTGRASLAPRGIISGELAVCGIAPGWTNTPYYEPAWMFGPSSKLLYAAFSEYAAYFTNVCKCAFYNNQYDESIAEKWLPSLNQELQEIAPRVLVLLGKYDIYQRIKIPSGSTRITVHHPSYALRSGKSQEWLQDLREQLRVHNVQSLPECQTKFNQDQFYNNDCILLSNPKTKKEQLQLLL